MNYVLIIAIGLILGCAGIAFGYQYFKTPLKIEFKVSVPNRIEQAMLMFISITSVMVFEIIINQLQLNIWKDSIGWRKIVSELLDAGLLVAFVIPLLSVIFAKWVEMRDLDLSGAYSEQFMKVYFSVVTITNCVWYTYMLSIKPIGGELIEGNLFSRIIIWGLNVFGTWFGIGFHCKGRIEKEKENIRKSTKKKDWKAVGKYSIPFVGTYVFFLLLLWSEVIWLEKAEKIIWSFCGIMMVAFIVVFVVGLVYMGITVPSKRRSIRILVRNINRKHQRECVEGKYGKIHYSLVEENNEKYILIHPRNVIWEGHEEEVQDKLGEKEIPVDKFDYRECRKLLYDIMKQQREFVKECFDKCKETVEEQLINEEI